MRVDGTTIAYLIIGMMGAGATITGTVMASMRALSHFDAKRDDARAQAEIARTEERAKEREHELKLARAQAETDHQDEVKKLQGQISEQAMKIAAIEEMVNTRLFEVIGEEHSSRRALGEQLSAHTATVSQAQLDTATAIQTLQSFLKTSFDGLGDDLKAAIEGLPALLRKDIQPALDQLQVVQRAMDVKIDRLFEAVRDCVPHVEDAPEGAKE